MKHAGGFATLGCLAFGVCISCYPISAAPPKPSRVPNDANHQALHEISNDLAGSAPELPDNFSELSATPPAVRNFIDEAIFAQIAADKIPRAALCSDTEYVRRISLDLTGRLPESTQVRKFVADKDPAKREKLIDSLMAVSTKGVTTKPSTPFLDRWTYFFSDLFRVSNLLGPGRTLFHEYIYNFLTVNQPYDEFVRELLTASSRSNFNSAPVNFLIRFYIDQPDQTTVNHEDTYDELAIRTTRMFLGVNVECISCHDGARHLEKVNLWLSSHKRTDVWKQAAFFGKVRMYRPYGDLVDEFVLNNEGTGYDTASKSVLRPKRYGKDITPTFFLTGEQPSPGEDPRAAYARMVTTNIQFARATVNLMWAELFGAGLVDPPTDFDMARYGPGVKPPEPWQPQTVHAELLDHLARDFQEHHFDLRYLIKLMVNSSTYQLSARLGNHESAWKPGYKGYFARRIVRRMPAEQVWDAISQATGVCGEMPAGDSNKKVKYVMQTVTPDDLDPKVRRLLGSFGLDDRLLSTRTTTASMVQSSILLNNELIKQKVLVQSKGRLADLFREEPPKTNEQMVEELFLSTLSRYPSKAESQFGVKLLTEQHERGGEDLLWVLLNKPEFLLNY